MEENKLLAHIENICSYAELMRLEHGLLEQLGIVLKIMPRNREVRTVRGLTIQLAERPGLCKKIRQSVPAAIRRCLEKNPAVVYAILDAHDLFGGEPAHFFADE